SHNADGAHDTHEHCKCDSTRADADAIAGYSDRTGDLDPGAIAPAVGVLPIARRSDFEVATGRLMVGAPHATVAPVHPPRSISPMATPLEWAECGRATLVCPAALRLARRHMAARLGQTHVGVCRV